MKRKLAALALAFSLCSAALVHGQGAAPNMPYGYPGYGPLPGAPTQPMAPYGQPMPNGAMPYGQPMPYPMPNGAMPYGQPMPMPYPMPKGAMPYGQPMPMPYPMPNGAQPMPMPYPYPMPPAGFRPNNVYVNPQPTPGEKKNQVLPDNVPTKPEAKKTEPTPAQKPSEMPGEPVTVYQGPSSGPPLTTEPVTLYEGNRYAGEIKLDGVTTWFQVSYAHWRTRRSSTPALATTGSTGILGAADTATLIGGEIGPREFNGIVASLGHWLDDDHMNAVEFGGLWFAKMTREYAVSSSAAVPRLTIPVVLGTAEGVVPVAAPGTLTGSVRVNSAMDFHGGELNVAQNLARVNGWNVDYLIGARYLYLNERLSIDQTRSSLTAGAISFAGVGVVPAGSTVAVSDLFNLTNRFYGGQVGARANWTSCYGFDIGITGKIAFGAAHHVADVGGSSTLSRPGLANTSSTGGTFAQVSNIGRHTSTDFAIVPQVDGTIGYQVTPHIRLTGGYSFLYWNRVERAGDQIDRRFNAAQSPTSATFNAAARGNPIFPASRSEFWAHGVNVGIEIKY
jgi:hypothetical protein